MSKLTTYTCDRCKKTSEKPNFLHSITVMVGSRYGNNNGPTVEWCRACVVEAGITSWTPSPPLKKEDLPEALSVEDLIREIIREEMESNGGNQ